MKQSIKTHAYNEKRYGRPYIARIANTDGKVIEWGIWLGTPGEEGLLEIEANAGDIIMHGQKDFRGNKGFPEYAILLPDGSFDYMTKAQAIKASRAAQASIETATA